MKKKTKKALALALCAVMLVAGTALTTIAYLTSEDSVTNTFTVGKVNITLDEALVNEYGQPASNVDGDGVYTLVKDVADAKRVKDNGYKLVPGVPYTKDPTVTVKEGSEESYVRMKVEVTNLAKVKEVFGTVKVGENDYFLPQYFVTGWNPDIWETTNVITEANDTATYEFRYYTTVNTVGKADQKLEALFTELTVPGTVTEVDLAKLNGGNFQIKITAEAIQAAGFANADAAWKAFDEQN